MQAAAGFLGMTSDGLEDVGPAISERTSSDQTASTSYAASEVDSAADDSSMGTGRSRAKYVRPDAASCGQGCAHHAANLPTQVLWHGQACLQQTAYQKENHTSCLAITCPAMRLILAMKASACISCAPALANHACKLWAGVAGKPRRRMGRRRRTARRTPEAVQAAMEVAMSLYSLSGLKLFREPVQDTKALLAWNWDMAVLAFRGTASLTNACSDLQVTAMSAHLCQAAHKPD